MHVVGEGTATITVKAAATDSYKAAKATVKITVNPKKATISKVSSTKKTQAKVTWKKDSKVTGYQVVYASNKSFTRNVTTVSVKKNTTTSLTIKNLSSKKRVYVRVRSYKTVNAKKMYGKFSTVKSVKVK
ncbi:MAG: fibronectin type III domain-containing protein [Lachnospiraceae bacterium]|nr:fibronectin type III domain-containing protein [Lachnospiraceae bacterium]